MTIMGAGILFTDGQSVLAGYHPSREAWSGFGGKCEEGESAQSTAIREVCEEVFGIKPTAEVQEEIHAALQLEEPTVRGDYALYVSCVDDLFIISELLEKNGYTSQFYTPSFPKVISALIAQRCAPETAEIRDILWMPMNEVETSKKTLTSEFTKDILFLLHK